MKKRATSLLLTLFLLLTSAQVWGADYVPNVVVAETSFESNTGSYPCKLTEIKCKNPSNESYNTSLQYVASDPSMNGTYTIKNGTLICKHNQGGTSNVLLSGSISGLVSVAGYNTYKITIKLASGGDYQVRCKTFYNGNGNYEVDKGPGSTIDTQATATSGSISFSLYYNWVNSGELKIESIKVVGYSEKKIISSESPAVCSGKETTLSALGATGTSYQWYVSDDDVNYTPIQGATQSTYKVTVSEAKYYKLNDVKGLLVYPVLCCSDNTAASVVSERFQMTTAAKAFEALPNGQIDPAYGHVSSSPIKDGKYAIVHKAEDGGYWNDSPIKAKSLSTDSKDGFLLVNCSQNDHGKAMYKRQFNRLCPNTLYKFSASVSSLSMIPGDIGIDVKFDVIAMNGPQNNQSLLPEPISVTAPSMSTTWIDKNISFVTTGCTSVEVRLYNNVDNSAGTGGNDVGIDDIVFGLCTPEIALYSNDAWSEKDREICPDDEPNTYIHVGSAMNLDEILPGQKYYYFEYKNGNTWDPVPGTNPTTSNKIKVDIQETTHSSGVLYRAWVAGDATTVVDAAKGLIVAGTCTSYAQSDAITLTYKCANPCTPINEPETIDFTSCVKAGTKQFYELIKNPKFAADKYVWEKEGSTASVPATFDTNVPGNSGIYKVKSIKHTHTDGVEYCESDWATVQVTISTNVPIVLSADGETYGPNETYKICLGSSATLIAQVDAGYNVDWTATPADPNIDVTTIHTNNITVTPTKTTTYTADASGSCYQQGSITIELTTAEKPVLKADEKSICLGSPIKITDTITETAEKYEWSVKKDNGSWETITNNVKNLENYTPSTEGKYSFKSKAINGQCEAESDEITVEVGAPITFTTSQPTTICEGSSTIISVSNINPSTANVQWFDEDDNKVGDDDGLPSVSVSPKENTKYKVSLWIEGGCKASDSVTITVDGKIEAAISADKDICIGDKTTLSAGGGTSYSWIPSSGLSSTTVANPVANPEKTTKYTVTITKGKCSVDTTTTVTVHELPVIETITITEGETYDRNADVTITKGTAPYSYSLNGEDYYDVPSEILNNVPIGWNLLYVKDKFNCESTKEFYVEPIPVVPAKYFTPNEDGVNDKWTVKNLDAYDSYIVEIFDRYGKRLYIKRVGSFNIGGASDEDVSQAFEGWDGIYNGHPMPSDDYWYLITVEEIRKQYTGHFTLKR